MATDLEPAAGPARAPSRLGRLREIATVMARHGFAPAMRRMPLVRSFVKEGEHAPARRPAAERFCAMLEDLGPTFVKLGQILSTRGDLLPPAFIHQLSRLQDQVPPFPFADVERQVLRGLGKPIDALFQSFDPTPLASASMAQVHAARTVEGIDVVVKVQRPGIAEQVQQDAEMLVVLAQLLELVIVEMRTYRAADFVAEFNQALAVELDFSTELRNLSSFALANRGRSGVHVPTPYPALSSTTILTMERVRGRRINDLAGTPQATAVIERLVEVSFEHVFVDGLFHGDPHPGNLMVTDAGEIAFIDFGLVGRVPRETQDRLLLLLLALSLRDADTVARLCVRLSESERRIELAPFRAQIGKLLDRYFGLALGEVNSAGALQDLVDLSTRFGLRMPREFAVLSKAVVSIEGVVRSLHPTFNPSTIIEKRAEELLLERTDPRQWRGGGLRSALQLGLLIQEVPLQLGQVLLDLERGQLRVNVASEELEQLGKNLRGLGMTIFGAVLAGASILGGFDVLARAGYGVVEAPVVAGLAFIVAGGCFGVSFAWYLTGGRLPKIGLSRLLPRRGQPSLTASAMPPAPHPSGTRTTTDGPHAGDGE